MIEVPILIGCLILAYFYFKDEIKRVSKKQARRAAQLKKYGANPDIWLNTDYHALTSAAELYEGRFYINCSYAKYNLTPAEAMKIATAYGWKGHNLSRL